MDFKMGFYFDCFSYLNMELNMNLVPLKYLTIISVMVHLMESRENGTAYGNLDDLFDGILLEKEYKTEQLMV